MVKYQEIYINLDDSGKLCSKEQISVYGGIVFFSKTEKDKFITQYRKIINDIKCNYCKFKNNCNNKCPEIKNINIKPSNKRRIMNYIKKYFNVALIINNDEVFDYIKNDKASKGRYVDYTIRRLIKQVVQKSIRLHYISDYKPLRIIINIDEQSTKSNGYYGLKDGIYEELIHGVQNFNYYTKIKPILFSDLEINLHYKDSRKCYVVQAADLVAGTVRRSVLSNDKNLNKLLDIKVLFP